MTYKGRGDGALVDERDKSVERSEGSTSLSRFILGANALKVGAASALVPIFVSFSSAVTGSSGPLLLAFLVSLLVLIPFGFLSAFAFGVATFVYEAFYLILPGREQRDQRWLASWRRQQGDAIEVLDTAGGSLFQFALVSKAGMSSVLHLPERAGENER